MSLSVDFTGIKDYEELCWQKAPQEPDGGFLIIRGSYQDDDGQWFAWTPVTTALVNMMPALALKGSITEKNVEEAVMQVAIYQQVCGPLLRFGASMRPLFVTPEDVRAHIGSSHQLLRQEQQQSCLQETHLGKPAAKGLPTGPQPKPRRHRES